MDFFNVLSLLGGLALFLYGMHVMGNGLEKVSSGHLERILERLTDSPWKAVILGAGVTAVIQSSSATTVMVVGFVNSGIMKLSQAVGVIMGANIGTTVTSWILSLTGIESTNFFLRMLKPSSFSPILAVIGVIFIMFQKTEKKKEIGGILIGFAILMFGMDAMSAAVKPLADVPEFTSLFIKFTNPLLGMLVGLIVTAIIQSSSASVGILQALCTTGAVSYASAIPIIMGQNIGTCVTALLSSIGTGKNARRAALVHLYFNMIGTCLFMIGFYAINSFVHFAFLSEAANTAGIAVVHTSFNVLATAVLLPFSKGLEKLACLTVRDEERESENDKINEFSLLNPRFLEFPSFAIEQCRNMLIRMAEISRACLFDAMALLDQFDEKKAEEIRAKEDLVDRYEDELSTYLVKLSGRDLLEKDSRELSLLLHCIGDFERICDHAVNIVESAETMNTKNIHFSKECLGELSVYENAVRDIVDMALDIFRHEDKELAKKLEPLEEVIDTLHAEMKSRHIDRLREGKCTVETGFLLSDLFTDYERVADHCSNIAIGLLESEKSGFEAHEILLKLKVEQKDNFNTLFREYKKKYLLPGEIMD